MMIPLVLTTVSFSFLFPKWLHYIILIKENILKVNFFGNFKIMILDDLDDDESNNAHSHSTSTFLKFDDQEHNENIDLDENDPQFQNIPFPNKPKVKATFLFWSLK